MKNNLFNRKKGILLCIYGSGKGKTTSCIGIMTRIILYNLSYKIIYFIKGNMFSGERILFKNNIVNNIGFNFKKKKLSFIDFKKLGRIWCFVINSVGNPYISIVMLDEISFFLSKLPINLKFIFLLKPNYLNLIITSRTRIKKIKIDCENNVISINHHYNKRTLAQIGIEY